MAVPLPTPRLVFREMTLDDLDDMAALLGDPEVMGYYPRPKNRDEASAWITWNQRLYRTYGYGLWLLSLGDTGEFVGDCGLTPQQVDGVTEIEVGYHVRACLQGRGLATEAAAACRDYARDVLEVDRLIAIIDPRNQPSQRVAENLGLVVARTSDNHGRWTSKRLIYAASLNAVATGWRRAPPGRPIPTFQAAFLSSAPEPTRPGDRSWAATMQRLRRHSHRSSCGVLSGAGGEAAGGCSSVGGWRGSVGA